MARKKLLAIAALFAFFGALVIRRLDWTDLHDYKAIYDAVGATKLCPVDHCPAYANHSRCSDDREAMAADALNKSITRLELLSQLVQESFSKVQYAAPCDSAKVFICDLGNNLVGFALRVHEVVFCHTIAYGLERSLLITNTHFGLENDGWSEQYLKTFNHCRLNFHEREVMEMQDLRLWSNMAAIDNTPRVMRYKHVWKLVSGPIPMFLAGTTPIRIAELLRGIHSNPGLWFIGQSTLFVLQLQPDFAKELDGLKKSIGYQSPIVGMHIRHGNKLGNERFGAEAEYIPESKFMATADMFFELNYPKVQVRNLFLATDDPNIIKNFSRTYPRYKFISLAGVSERAQSYDSKAAYSADVLKGIVLDILLLSATDFVVCTMSSNVGRVVHELRQAIFPTDQTTTLYSMDSGWHFGVPGFSHDGRFRLLATQDFGNLSAKGDLKFYSTVTFTSYLSHQRGDFVFRISPAFQHTDGKLVYKGQNARSSELGLVRADLVLPLELFLEYPEPWLRKTLSQLYPEQ